MDKKNKPTLEHFKNELLRWKNGHAEEYSRFARVMQSCDGSGFIKFCEKANHAVPRFVSQWRQAWNSDDVASLDDMIWSVRDSGLPEKMLKEYEEDRDKPVDESIPLWHTINNFMRRLVGLKPVPVVNLSAPMVLSWLFFGKSFETIYEIIVTQLSKDAADNMDKDSCLLVGMAVVRSSIKNGYRTKEDWEAYFKRRKAMGLGSDGISGWIMEEIEKEFSTMLKADEPSADKISEAIVEEAPQIVEEPKTSGRRKAETRPLVEYLNCENKDAVIDIIREHIKANNTGIGLSLPYFALSELDLFIRMIADKEYSVAIAKQFEDIANLKSESSCRQALGTLRKHQFVLIDGKQRSVQLIKSDEIVAILEKLKSDIKAAISISN
ncbi:DUF6043 family protein [uncultured Bacteroides sp.]|uniref:DUF6043 family protein n=1 Tax=uncultured Bacteroides sp. TaxID=162156 RepID=UPI00261AA3CA|nr:DUF6043 family protein [uncultured Bacteroides sp.]